MMSNPAGQDNRGIARPLRLAASVQDLDLAGIRNEWDRFLFLLATREKEDRRKREASPAAGRSLPSHAKPRAGSRRLRAIPGPDYGSEAVGNRCGRAGRRNRTLAERAQEGIAPIRFVGVPAVEEMEGNARVFGGFIFQADMREDQGRAEAGILEPAFRKCPIEVLA